MARPEAGITIRMRAECAAPTRLEKRILAAFIQANADSPTGQRMNLRAELSLSDMARIVGPDREQVQWATLLCHKQGWLRCAHGSRRLGTTYQLTPLGVYVAHAHGYRPLPDRKIVPTPIQMQLLALLAAAQQQGIPGVHERRLKRLTGLGEFAFNGSMTWLIRRWWIELAHAKVWRITRNGRKVFWEAGSVSAIVAD